MALTSLTSILNLQTSLLYNESSMNNNAINVLFLYQKEIFY